MIPVSNNFLDFWRRQYTAVQLRVLHIKELWEYLTGKAIASASSYVDPNTPDKAIDGNLSTYFEAANISSVENGSYIANDYPENKIFFTVNGNNYSLLPITRNPSGGDVNYGSSINNWRLTWKDDATANQLSTYIVTNASPYGLIWWDGSNNYVLQPSQPDGYGYAHIKKITNIPQTRNGRTIYFDDEWELKNGTTATMRWTSGWSITSERDTAYGDIYLSIHGNGNIELYHRPNRSTPLSSILLATHSLQVGHKVHTRMIAKNGRYKFWLEIWDGTQWITKVNGYEIVLYDFVNLYPEIGSYSPASETPPQRWQDWFYTGYLNLNMNTGITNRLQGIIGLTDNTADNRFMGWATKYNEAPEWDLRGGVSVKFKIYSPAGGVKTNFTVRIVDNPSGGIVKTGFELRFHNKSITGSALEFYSTNAGHEIEIVGRLNSSRTQFFGVVKNTNLDTNITIEQPISLAAVNPWTNSTLLSDGGIGFGACLYNSESIYDWQTFYQIDLAYFKISTNQEWLKLTLNEETAISKIRITFYNTNTTPATLYCVFNSEFENIVVVIAPSVVQEITVNRYITEMLFFWSTSAAPVRIKEVEMMPTQELNVKDFSVARKKDYKLEQTLVGEVSLTCSEEYSRFSVNDKIQIQAAYNYEYITIWTGYIDRIQEQIGKKLITIKCRDAMKPFTRKKLAPNELEEQKIKTILDKICDECNIPAANRDFNDPSIFLDYWAPDDVKAIDEIKKIIGASIDSEFYADENGKLIFRSYMPAVKVSEVWDTDNDFNTKKSSISNFVVSGNKLITNPTPTSMLQMTPATKNIQHNVGWWNWDEWYEYLNEECFIIDNISPAQTIVGFKIKFVAYPAKEYYGTIGGEPAVGALFPRRVIYIGLDSNLGFLGDWEIDEAQFFDYRMVESGQDPLDRPFSEFVLNLNPPVSNITWLVFTIQISYRFNSSEAPGSEWTFNSHGKVVQLLNFVGLTYGTLNNLYFEVLDEQYDQGIISEIYTPTGVLCNWESNNIPASPTQLDLFEAIDDGYSGFNYYMRYSDDGISFSPKIYIPKNTIPSVPLKPYYRIGVDVFTLLQNWIDLLKLNWWISGGGDRFSRPIVLELTQNEIKSMTRFMTDEVGGGTILINNVEVKAQPKYVSGSDETVWQGTVNGQPISPSNPLVVSSVPMVFQIDLEEPVKEATQSVAITWSSGGTSINYVAHATKPVLTINSTGTITDLRIVGRTILKDANIAALASDTNSINTYGEAKESIDNDYINKIEIAQAKADLLINRYKNPVEIYDVTAVFTPQLQIGDIIRIIKDDQNINVKAYILEITHTVSVGGENVTADTRLKVLVIP
jgi:hypothetical protein